MMKVFYLLILAIPSFVYSQSTVSLGSASAGSGFEFKPEVTYVRDSGSVAARAIEMRSFTAKIASRAMQLQWSMAKGTNHNGLVLERSLDGHSFDAIGTIEGAIAGGYVFTDHGILHCVTWYRLKQTDAHGNSSYSATVSVSLAREKTDKIFIYPNSNEGVFGAVLPFSVVPADYKVSVYNQLGQLAEYTADLADGTILLQMDNEPAGEYTLVVEADGQTYVNSFEKAE